MAGSTGLEPAASGVTGRCSNQLNYDPAILFNVKINSIRFFFPTSKAAKMLNPKQKTLHVVSKPALRGGVGETGLEPVTPGL